MSTESPQSNKKLPLLAKLSFGAGDMGAGLTANLIAFSLLGFLINVAGLSPGLAGKVLAIGKIWDALTDPLIGFLSDRTQSRWGRRHPWMLFGSIPFGLSFALIWVVPDIESTDLKFAYYVVITLIFFTSYTAVNLPYAALTPELTQDYDERTSLNSFRLSFSVGGAVFGLVLGLLISGWITDERARSFIIGVTAAIIAVIPFYLCIWGTRPYLQSSQPHSDPDNSNTAPSGAEAIPFPAQLKIVFSNRPFLYVIGIYLLSWLALQVITPNIEFFAKSWMGLDTHFLVGILVQGCAIPMMFVCGTLSQRLGKRGLYFVGIGSWILIQMCFFFLQPGQTGMLYMLAFLASFGVATAYIVPWSMLPDVIELDELETGQRREGVFYSFMTLLQKIGLAAGIFIVGEALERAGFIPAVPGAESLPTQPDSALLVIRFVIGPFPAICLALSLILAFLYPITRDRHAEILLKLRERTASNQEGQLDE